MTPEITVLALNAAALGVLHTLIGPDHYLPFIVLARARRWSTGRTVALTAACGVGHVASSIALGFLGVALGVALDRLEWIESSRGTLAAWALIAFGLVYGAWGLRRALRAPGLGETHAHGGLVHAHEPGEAPDAARLTPWVLFLIFAFGPCEPLIPLFIYPAAMHSVPGMVLVAGAFGVATIGTMLAVVLAGVSGLRRVRWAGAEKFSHALAGFTLAAAGLAVQFLGL